MYKGKHSQFMKQFESLDKELKKREELRLLYDYHRTKYEKVQKKEQNGEGTPVTDKTLSEAAKFHRTREDLEKSS